MFDEVQNRVEKLTDEQLLWQLERPDNPGVDWLLAILRESVRRIMIHIHETAGGE